MQRDQFTGSLIPLSKHPAFAKLIGHPAVISALDQVGLSDLRFMSGYVISKPPGSPSLGWHQDGWYWDDIDAGYGATPAQVFGMIYLTNTSVHNGCLRVVPGSHRAAHALHARLRPAHSEEVRSTGKAAWKEAPEHSCDVEGATDVPVQAGDLVVGDARLLHGAHPNESDERRTVITIWYINRFSSWSTAFRDGVVRLHLRNHEMYALDETADWPQDGRALVRPLLPETEAMPLVGREAAMKKALQARARQHARVGARRLAAGWPPGGAAGMTTFTTQSCRGLH